MTGREGSPHNCSTQEMLCTQGGVDVGLENGSDLGTCLPHERHAVDPGRWLVGRVAVVRLGDGGGICLLIFEIPKKTQQAPSRAN